MRLRLDDTPEPLNLGSLPLQWQATEAAQARATAVASTWQTMQLTARVFDEAQPAGPRTYINATRYLQIAADNHSAFRSLIQSHGVTHWAHWNLLRPVLEASFHAAWILDPAEGVERRRRGLRTEVLDARERSKWVDALRKAGLASEPLDALARSDARSTTVYRREADELGLPWSRARGPIALVDELPKLECLQQMYQGPVGALLTALWRRLSGSQHGMSYALLVGTDQDRDVPIPGGSEIHLTANDDDFVMQCQLVNSLHLAALQLWVQRNTAA